MSPESERSDQVVARVVAWHNRHPLATRITAAQVHSVGVVSLPFAVRGAQVQPLPQLPAAEARPVNLPEPAEPAAPPADEPPADAGTLVELVTEDDAPAPAAAAAAGDPAAPPDTTERAPAAQSRPEPAIHAEAVPPAEITGPHLPSRPVRLQRQVTLPPRQAQGWLRRWLQRWRGPREYRALFSEDFIAPLRPAQVARWAALHGSPAWPLGPEAPLRLVHLDDRRRDAKAGGAAAPEVDLHLLTAAVGVGEQRLRLLLAPAPDAAVIGPRHYDRGRVAAAAAPLALLLIGLFTALPGLNRPQAGADLAAQAASAAAQAASGAASAAVPLRLAAAASKASAASALPDAASAPPAAPSAPTTTVAASAPPARPASAAALAQSAASAPPVRVAAAGTAAAAASAAPSAPKAAALKPGVRPPALALPTAAAASTPQRLAAAGPAATPASSQPRRGRVALGPLVPRLDDGDRSALREQAQALRGQPQAPRRASADTPGAAVPAKAWALVTRPGTDRRQTERAAAQLQALALLQRTPMRAELMPAGAGAWRAVFWPFRSAQDAEKVRLALADKGLRTEVVEF